MSRWYTNEEILVALREAERAAGRRLSIREWTRGGFRPAASLISRRFGSWGEAWAEAGVTDNHDYQRLGEALAALSMLLGDRRPTMAEWNRWPKKPCSASGVYAYYGSWRRFLDRTLPLARSRSRSYRSVRLTHLLRLQPGRIESLGGRRREVADLLLAGLPPAAVARRLGVSDQYVSLLVHQAIDLLTSPGSGT